VSSLAARPVKQTLRLLIHREGRFSSSDEFANDEECNGMTV
jgi:hypothetical protein